MFFGNTPPQRPRGLLGMFAPGQGQIPMPQQQQPVVAPEQADQMQTLMGASMNKKPGFFAEGGIGRMIAGGLGDVLMQQSGGQPIYQQHLMQQKAMQQRQQMAQQQREADWWDWQKQFDYEAKNKPKTPHYWESNDGSLMVMGETGPQRVYSDPTPKYNWIPDGMGGGRYEAIPGTGGAPQYPAKPVGKLTPIAGGASGNVGGGFPVSGKATGFDSYKSGSYDPLEVSAGKEFGVPPEVLNRLRVRGEKSNAGQVSEVGAKSVYQITPETRQLIIQKYKFDPWANPQDAARGAAIVARDMYRKFGNWNDAMTGYHGGNDTRNWGKRTQAYAQRTNY